MVDLKLARLPNRTPMKLTVAVMPDLFQSLMDYAAIYNETYGQNEPLAELVPHMLSAFIATDRAFGRALSDRNSRGRDSKLS